MYHCHYRIKSDTHIGAFDESLWADTGLFDALAVSTSIRSVYIKTSHFTSNFRLCADLVPGALYSLVAIIITVP